MKTTFSLDKEDIKQIVERHFFKMGYDVKKLQINVGIDYADRGGSDTAAFRGIDVEVEKTKEDTPLS